MVTIQLMFKLIGDVEWRVIDVSPEEFFVPDEEPPGVESIPVYDHVLDYLYDNEIPGLGPEDKRRVWITREVRTDAKKGQSATITETYWNEQRSCITERVDVGLEPGYPALILQSRVSDDPQEDEVIRFVRDDGCLVPEYHAFFTTHPDGSESERNVDLQP